MDEEPGGGHELAMKVAVPIGDDEEEEVDRNRCVGTWHAARGSTCAVQGRQFVVEQLLPWPVLSPIALHHALEHNVHDERDDPNTQIPRASKPEEACGEEGNTDRWGKAVEYGDVIEPGRIVRQCHVKGQKLPERALTLPVSFQKGLHTAVVSGIRSSLRKFRLL